ncbi:MAG TPA: carboxymuconolactone decarboxylase family protein [Steroidobacteraceae bacterium]|nr:carboxymuconolactone decarboxylase family protein [Steroidobacteraceae bacterium]
MPRIPYPDVTRLPETVQRTLASVPLNVVRICAHASLPLFEAQGQLGRAVASLEVLEPRLRETIILRVAYLSDSEYELHHHIPLGRAAGLTEEELGAIAEGSYGRLEPLLAAAACFTDEVVQQLSPSERTLARLRQLASDQILVNIVLTIGCYMSIARLVAVTGIEPDAQALQHLPTSADAK